MDISGYERSEFSAAIDIHYETLGRHIRDNTLPKKKATRRQIEKVTGFSIKWIETGEGPEKLPSITGTASIVDAGERIHLTGTTMQPQPPENPFDVEGMVPGEERTRLVPSYGAGGEITHYYEISVKWLSVEEVKRRRAGR